MHVGNRLRDEPIVSGPFGLESKRSGLDTKKIEVGGNGSQNGGALFWTKPMSVGWGDAALDLFL
jgi:hypothetical protein